MEYKVSELDNSMKDVAAAHVSERDISIDCDFNELSPLQLMAAFERSPTVQNTYKTAVELCDTKTILFKRDGKVIQSVQGSPNMESAFKDSAYLLQALLKVCFLHITKKLLPPSVASENEGKQPA